jgi:FHS family L-fucose permease-like MFS transporter
MKTESSRYPIIIIGILFFIFGFITWLNSVLIPYLKVACELTNFQSYLVTFAFYIAYFVMGIPSGQALKLVGYKKGMSLGLIVIALGALVFIPAAISRVYWVFLVGLFIQGTGLALLQTASNPYITFLGPKESAAQRISIMGICNKFAGALAPIALGAVALKNVDGIVAALTTMSENERIAELNQLAMRVVNPYIIITIALVILAAFVFYSRLPEINETEGTSSDDANDAASVSEKSSVWQIPHIWLGAITLFCYVGVEVLAGDSIIAFASEQGIHMDRAKFFTSLTLGSMILGYVLGIIIIPSKVSQEKALQYSGLLGVILSIVLLLTDGSTSVFCLALLGLANALVWPAIWPLALADSGKFAKQASSLLIMGIAGGAIIPLLYGYLADEFSAKYAYFILVPMYALIYWYAAYGSKIRK